MSISEDEFAWIATSDSNSSISMSSNESIASQNDYEFETSKNYKKNLHKKLFNNDSNQLNNGISESTTGKTSKKKKYKGETPDNNFVTPNDKEIKVEPESDIDSKLRRKKERQISENGYVSETTLFNYLNKKVKEEQDIVKPKPPKAKERLLSSSCNLDELCDNIEDVANSRKKKKKKHKNKNKDNDIESDNINNDTSNDHSLAKKRKKKKRRHNSESKSEENKSIISEGDKNDFDQSCVNINSDLISKKTRKKSILLDNEIIDDSKNKPKKSKKLKKSLVDSFSEMEENQNTPSESKTRKVSIDCISHENYSTTVKSKKKKKRDSENKSNNDNINEIPNHSIISESNETVEISAILNTDNTIDHTEMEQDQTLTNQDEDDSDISEPFKQKSTMNESEINITSSANMSILKRKNGTIKSNKLFDKIRFEDSEKLDSDSENRKDDYMLNSQVEKYINKNSNLKIINKKMTQGSILTENDEIWVLTVPSDVTIDMFKDAKITIDNKCKIKINNESYVGNLDQSCGNKCNILFQNAGELAINSVYSNGTIQLHKRLPKSRIMDDNIVVDKRSFIPLPETKCRHPIFGPDYEIAMEIPSEVKDRLNQSIISCEKKHRKKTKKVKSEEIDVEVAEIETKKKKKRKISRDDINHVPKKVKYDPDSVEAWESEKAIEENLFNF